MDKLEMPLVLFRESVVNRRNIKKNPAEDNPEDKTMFSRVINSRLYIFSIPFFYKIWHYKSVHNLIITKRGYYV